MEKDTTILAEIIRMKSFKNKFPNTKFRANYSRHVDTCSSTLKIEVSRNLSDWTIFSDLIGVPDDEVQRLLNICDEVNRVQ